MSTQEKQKRRLARKIEEYDTAQGVHVKVYVKRATDDPPPGVPLVYYFRCAVGAQWVTYVVIITEGLRAVLGAKQTSDDAIVHTALKYVKNEVARGNLIDGTELEFGPLQEGLFPGR